MSDEKKDEKLNIELSEEIAEGQYSNLAIISHSSSEFVFDFIKIIRNFSLHHWIVLASLLI